ESQQDEAPMMAVSIPSLTEEDEAAAAVAIAVAVAMALTEEKKRERGVWSALESAHGGSSPWTNQGRQIQMNSRNIARETRR
ncbi:MAG: hypothetical protein Q7O66_21250, partial [Dehalococcoidia bacterium]|nr:hypothetical protein [Dehalococcoidia bacterium]